MHDFHYQDGSLYCEGVNLESLAKEHATPLYVYSSATIHSHYDRLDSSLEELDHQIEYAVKANSNLSILKLLAEKGSGFDIVSAGELYRVMAAGGDPAKCTFAGVGKTREEIKYALKHQIYAFNVESEAELRFIDEIASKMDLIAPVAIRVNPNVDAKTHKYISTGKSENKFGIEFEAVEALYESASHFTNIHLKGIQMHIGSQLTSVKPFIEAVEKVAPLAAKLKERHGIEFFSIGGGIGIVYDTSLDSGREDWWTHKKDEDRPLTVNQYAKEVVPRLKKLGLKILLEPGRFIVGNAGVLLSTCLYEKRGNAKTFKIVDAGMNDLIRPALYEGYHEIVPLKQNKSHSHAIVDVVGPICETGDFFCQDREVANFKPGDHIALMSCGAYGFTMASTYNSRPLAAEILVDQDQASVIRRRQTYEEMIDSEREAL